MRAGKPLRRCSRVLSSLNTPSATLAGPSLNAAATGTAISSRGGRCAESGAAIAMSEERSASVRRTLEPVSQPHEEVDGLRWRGQRLRAVHAESHHVEPDADVGAEGRQGGELARF